MAADGKEVKKMKKELLVVTSNKKHENMLTVFANIKTFEDGEILLREFRKMIHRLNHLSENRYSYVLVNEKK